MARRSPETSPANLFFSSSSFAPLFSSRVSEALVGPLASVVPRLGGWAFQFRAAGFAPWLPPSFVDCFFFSHSTYVRAISSYATKCGAGFQAIFIARCSFISSIIYRVLISCHSGAPAINETRIGDKTVVTKTASALGLPSCAVTFQQT